MSLNARLLGGRKIHPIGLGCMNLSHAYGVPPSPKDGALLIHRALDLGVEHFDTAALYGFGRNEDLVGQVLQGYRDKVFLASKCGMTGADGMRVIDGRPQTLKQTCEDSLQRLRADHIDLYYLHRWDKAIAIEEQVGALGDLVREGKIGAVGLSEVSAPSLRRAHKEYPIAAVQSEYSLWTRNPELGVLDACAEIGAAFVAFSPLGRGFLAGGVRDNRFVKKDIRIPMPRFQGKNFSHNLQRQTMFDALAARCRVAPAQLALSWVLSRGAHVHVIPGTTSMAHLEDNIQAGLAWPSIMAEAEAIFAPVHVRGHRYAEANLAEIDTEEGV